MNENSADGDSPALTLDRHVGSRLAAARCRAGLTAAAVATALDVGRKRYGAAEKGEARLTPSEMVACADLLMVPVTYFFGDFAPGAVAADDRPQVRRDNVVAFPVARLGRK